MPEVIKNNGNKSPTGWMEDSVIGCKLFGSLELL